VSTLHWSLGVRPTDVREVMEPDLPAPPRFSNYVVGKDEALDRIRAYAPNAVLSDRLLERFAAAGLEAAFSLYRTSHTAEQAASPWGSDVQQLLAFAYGTIGKGDRADVLRAFDFVTEMYPRSHQAWAERGRVRDFVGDSAEVRRSFARAHELRPQNELIKRFDESARRKQ
jgi:hypothetical protein